MFPAADPEFEFVQEAPPEAAGVGEEVLPEFIPGRAKVAAGLAEFEVAFAGAETVLAETTPGTPEEMAEELLIEPVCAVLVDPDWAELGSTDAAGSELVGWPFEPEANCAKTS